MPDWAAVGAIGELLGALGVLATLVYLSLQVRANTEQTRLAIVENIMAREIENRERLLISDIPALSVAIEQGRELTPEEQRRFGFYMQGTFQAWEAAFYMHRNHTLSSEVYDAIEFRRLHTIGIREYWAMFRRGFTASFREHADELLDYQPPD